MATGTYATRKWPYDKITMPRAAPADTMSASESRLAPNAPCSPVRPDVRLATGPSTTASEAADVEVTESHSRGHREQHGHGHVRNPKVAIRQDHDAEGSPGIVILSY